MHPSQLPVSGHLISQFRDPILAEKLWRRVSHLMPGLENRKAAGLNEHLRFLRYGKALGLSRKGRPGGGKLVFWFEREIVMGKPLKFQGFL